MKSGQKLKLVNIEELEKQSQQNLVAEHHSLPVAESVLPTLVFVPTDNVCAALYGRHHERSEVGVVGQVDFGAARNERLDALDAASECRHVKGRPTQSVPWYE